MVRLHALGFKSSVTGGGPVTRDLHRFSIEIARTVLFLALLRSA
jgi:hypothetical protein